METGVFVSDIFKYAAGLKALPCRIYKPFPNIR